MNQLVLSRVKRHLPRFLMRFYEHQLLKETHINRALRLFGKNTTYVEIGVRDGPCIRQIKAGRKCAIDPAPINPQDIQRDGTHLFQMTSDHFFEAQASHLFRSQPVDVALVDGLHEFRQALRDVLNLEPFMAKGGVVFIHDCNPPSRRHTEDRNYTWNGDVWKVPYYLTHYRKDLEFFTLDCDWGLGVVRGFSQRASAPEPEVIEAVAALDFDILDRERRRVLNLRNALYSLLYFTTRRALPR